MSELPNECPVCGYLNLPYTPACTQCFIGFAFSDVPLPRWCQPQPPRRTRYLLDNLDTAAAREITRLLTPSNRRRAARERGSR